MLEVKIDVQKGVPWFRENLILDVLVQSDWTNFILCYHVIIVLNDYLDYSCWGWHLVSRVLQFEGSWSAHGFPWVLLVELWLSYCALVFVCLMNCHLSIFGQTTCQKKQGMCTSRRKNIKHDIDNNNTKSITLNVCIPCSPIPDLYSFAI